MSTTNEKIIKRVCRWGLLAAMVLLVYPSLASGQSNGPWQSGSGGSGGGVTPNTSTPVNGVNVFNVKNFGAVGDAKNVTNITVNNGSSTVTRAAGDQPFLPTDCQTGTGCTGTVNKNIWCLTPGGLSALTPTIGTITAYTSGRTVTVSSVGNGNATGTTNQACVWYTQKETTAFRAAGTAAGTGLNQYVPQFQVGSAGTVYCPPGGYVLDGPILVQVAVNPGTSGVSFVGSGKSSCRIYMSPDVAASGGAWVAAIVQTWGTNLSGFTVACNAEALSVAVPGIWLDNAQNFTVKDVEQDGCGTSGDTQGQLALVSSQNGYIDGYFVNGAAAGSPEPALGITGSNTIHVRNMSTVNPGNSGITITGSGGQAAAFGPRSGLTGGVTIENSIFDEGGVPGCCVVTSGSSVNFIGVTGLAGTLTTLTVSVNSSAYITDSNFIPFGGGCSAGTRQALTLAGNSAVYSTGTEYQGCGSDGTGLSAAVSGPSNALFVDLGGNTFRNCTGTLPCPAVTVAQYATLGFNGGIVPKATVTHTPNTCTDTLGTVVSTLLCNSLLDQNYQILNITASSNASTTCATAPVVTISDGVQTATLTLTTAKSAWSSTVDVSSGINSVFAAGNTMKVTYDLSGLGACAVPPTNLAVSYVLQSVLNP
jgi:hypothetical protein